MKKKVEIHLKRTLPHYDNGCCATMAISSAFGLSMNGIRTICTILKYDWTYGLTFFEIKKLIRYINKQIEYTPNKAGLKYWQLVEVFKDRKMLVMFSEHLSYAEKGVVYDSYLCDSNKKMQWFEGKPTGWWIV